MGKLGRKKAESKGATGKAKPVLAEEPKETVLEMAHRMLKYPDLWLDTPNPKFNDRAPRELIGTPEEIKLYNLFNAAQWGMF